MAFPSTLRLRYTIAFLLFGATILFSTEVRAQLLEDTDKKLKTTRKEGRGFLGGLFSKRGKSGAPTSLSFGRTSNGDRIQPRYSRPFAQDARARQYRSVSFRDPYAKDKKTPKPRYSTGSPFTEADRAVTYWRRSENPWPNKRYKSEIKSITGMPFTKKDQPAAPRFSTPPPRKYYNVKPPYSGTPNFNMAMREFWKNFKRPSAPKDAGPVMRKQEREKYKNIAKYRGPFPELRAKRPKAPANSSELGPVVWNVPKKRKPEDVSSYLGPFDELRISKNRYKATEKKLNDYLGPHGGIRISKNTYKKSSSDLAEYLGPHKIKIARVKGDLHPSYRYKRTVLMKSDLAKDGLRKWNVFWAGINRNQEAPKGVKEKISKPKFDKKEREIWNN